MEKGPEIRIVGSASIEEKEEARKEIYRALFNHFESLLPEEQELLKNEPLKSKEQLALISFANEETSRLMREAGLEPYNVPEENFHIIKPELYEKITGHRGTAETFYTKQGVIFNESRFDNKLFHFGVVALHEMLHLKAHLSMEVQENNGQVKKTFFREGVKAKSSQKQIHHGKDHDHFSGLNEAIVAETEKKLSGKLLDLPELAAEKKWMMSEEAKEIKKRLAEKEGIPENDIIWVDKEGHWKAASYPQQRAVLNYICAEIQKEFPGQFQNTDDVYKTFLNAHFTGHLVTIGRLVEKTFGKDSFRLLGNMDTNEKSGILHLESLEKARRRQMREKQSNIK